MSARTEILVPAVQRMLADGHSREEIAATLRVHADLIEGKADPAEEAGKRKLAEEVANGFTGEGVPVKLSPPLRRITTMTDDGNVHHLPAHRRGTGFERHDER